MFTFNDDYFNSFLSSLLVGGSLVLTGCSGDTATTPIVTIAPAPTQIVAPAPAPVDNTATLTSNLTVWQNGVDYYQLGSYMVINNTWGADKFGLVYAKDYTQTVTYDMFTPNKGMSFTWDYPDTPYGDGAVVYGYPSIAWGKTALPLSGYNTDNVLTQVKYITSWTQNYNVTLSGDLKYMNLMSDMWFFGSDGKITGEITLNLHPSDHILYWADPKNFFGQQPDAHNHEFFMDGVHYNMLVTTSYGTETPQRLVMILPTDGSKNTAGTIDWVQILDILEEHNDIHPDWFVKGIEMGVEVQAGDGSMIVNDFFGSMTYLDPMTNSYYTFG